MSPFHRVLRLSAVILLTVGTSVLRADTYSTFNLNGSLDNGGSVFGTVTLDSTTGLFTGANFTVNEVDAFFPGGLPTTFTAAPAQRVAGSQYVAGFTSNRASDVFVLYFPQTSLAGYGGGSVCSRTNPCSNGFGPVFSGFSYVGDLPPDGTSSAVVSGALTLETAATPEPSSLLLLATGSLTVAWRRVLAR